MNNLVQIVPVGNFNNFLSRNDVLTAAGVGDSDAPEEGELTQRLLSSAVMKVWQYTGYVVFQANIVEKFPTLCRRTELEASGLIDSRLPDASIVSNVIFSYIPKGASGATVTSDFRVDATGNKVAVLPNSTLLAKELDDDFANAVTVSYAFNPGTFVNLELLRQAAMLYIRAEHSNQAGEGDMLQAEERANDMLFPYKSEYIRA